MRLRRVLLPAAGAVTLMFLSTGAAHADPAPEPRQVDGNVTTCDAAGLTGTILFQGEPGDGSGEAGSGDVSDDGLTLTVTINAGWTASGVAVKGGPDTNVYDGPFVGPTTIEGMKAFFNPGSQQPKISHWFVCGEETPPPPPGSPTPPPPPGTPTPTPPNGGTPPPGDGTPAPSGPAKTGGGGSQGGVSWYGIAALVTAAASAGFLMLRRKRA